MVEFRSSLRDLHSLTSPQWNLKRHTFVLLCTMTTWGNCRFDVGHWSNFAQVWRLFENTVGWEWRQNKFTEI